MDFPGKSPASFVLDEDGAILEEPLELLRRYFGTSGSPEAFTGRHFDVLIDAHSPYRYTADDLVAVSMLSVNVPPESAAWLLGVSGDALEVSRLLRRIPADVDIWDHRADLGRDSAAWELWSLLDARAGLGPTITSKLMAAKRPRLVPVQDQVVWNALMGAEVTGYWEAWRDHLRGSLGQKLVVACDVLRAQAKLPVAITTLRILDVVIWMAKTHPASPPD